jgi:hypothetical protein
MDDTDLCDIIRRAEKSMANSADVLALAAEVNRLRQKNKELNRRAQEADTAFREAHEALRQKWEWRGGSFGRALLAYHCSQLEANAGVLINELRDIYNATFLNPATCSQELLENVVRVVHEGTDKALKEAATWGRLPDAKVESK